MDKPSTHKRVQITSVELANALGLPVDARVIELRKEVYIKRDKAADARHPAPAYGDVLTLEWREWSE